MAEKVEAATATAVPTIVPSPNERDASPVRAASPVRQESNIFLNVHGTLLTLDNGRAFPRNSVMRLTPAEVARFKKVEATTKQRFIVAHPGPAHND